ncbi:WhiB family transcriptional regulator [Streptomyces sp. NPDC056161]|uniref:WhiB family transcriptional regulator n=1 Tax=Streptomyces sp. NPDC056161 TaxID=3345732 RepID=UPI0035D9A7D9
MTRRARTRYAPDTLPRPVHWSKDAACLRADPALFHPEGDAGTVLLETAEAKTYCARCVVQERCLADSLARNEPYGVWGGLDEKARRLLLRRRRERERAARRRAERKREEAADAISTTAEVEAPEATAA